MCVVSLLAFLYVCVCLPEDVRGAARNSRKRKRSYCYIKMNCVA